MIAKGTARSNGVQLAAYMVTSQDGQRAELWQLRGFEATNIKDAFRNVQIMAGATQCEQPFFHVQVRNREGETLTPRQWEYAADRIERMLGLTGQPRAITFHTYEHNDDQHMHVAWSRIDQDTLTAKPLPFFKERLKKISRELELHFGMEPVTNTRKGPIKYAPTQAQEEQARRVGVDIHAVRNTIRYCWDHSDNGRSFQAALEHEGMILAQGDRRGIVVIDQGGGVNSLSKRILDVTASKIRDRISDLDVAQLPTVEEARSYLPGLHDTMSDLKRKLAEVGKQIDRAEHEQGIQTLRDGLTEVDKLLADTAAKQRPENKPAPIWDRDRADRVWQDAVINAAIEKEKTERQFTEPRDRRTGSGSREEKDWPIMPPQPENKHWTVFAKAANEATRDDRTENLKGEAAKVWTAFRQSDSAKAFAASLDDKGIAFARVTKEEVERSHRQADFAKAVGNKAPRFKKGEIVIVTEQRAEYRRAGQIIVPPRVHKLDQSLAGKFVDRLDGRSELHGIDVTRKSLDERAIHRSANWEAIRLENATRYRDGSRKGGHGNVKVPAAHRPVRRGFGAVGKVLDVAARALESLIAPTLTPEQIREGQKAVNRREAEAEHTIDFSSYTAEMSQQRQREEQEREAARQRQRERERGGRER